MRYLRSLGMCLVDPRSNVIIRENDDLFQRSPHIPIIPLLQGGGVDLMHVTAVKYSTHLKSAFDTR